MHHKAEVITIENKISKPKRVLHVVSAMDRGGAEVMLMNLYRSMDRDRLQFDFVSHADKVDDFETEIEELGGKVFHLSSLGTSGFLSYYRQLSNLIKKEKYTIVHAHTDMQTGVVLFIAFLSSVKTRIAHAHSTKWKKDATSMEKAMYFVLKIMANLFSTKKVACGKQAGEFMFYKRYQNSVVHINNGIDLERFVNVEISQVAALRESLCPEDCIILGHIGRFTPEKNHSFLVALAERLEAEKQAFKLFLVGDGPLRAEMEKVVKTKSLTDKVVFLGKREDVHVLMKLFDLFLLPSLYEGLPVTLIEAQAAGTSIIMSDTITSEADLGMKLIEMLPTSHIEQWANSIREHKPGKGKVEVERKVIIDRGYSAKANVSILYGLYNVYEQ